MNALITLVGITIALPFVTLAAVLLFKLTILITGV